MNRVKLLKGNRLTVSGCKVGHNAHVGDEVFPNLRDPDPVVVLLADTARESGVLVTTPYSIAPGYDASDKTMVLLDGHAHGAYGILLASMPRAAALEFLKEFFIWFYPCLAGNEHTSSIAQFTMLSEM